MTDLAYYLTFGRMPTLGLDAWQAIYRSYQADGVSRVVLWTGGAFRSRRFPITWQYNRTHRNIESDFLAELIDYGHTLGIKTLLGFVPYDYDGINQFPLEQPRLRAIGADGNYLESQGIHCWGYALNPALEESRRLVLGYVKELYDDFYPNADGILIESSDLKLGSGSGDYFSLEYELIHELAEEYWAVHPDGELIIYPHYFRADRGQLQPYDPRWRLVFTSHSAEAEQSMIDLASYSYYADYSIMVGDPERVRESCRLIRDRGISCYFPPFEFFTYRPPQPDMREPHLIGRPLRPFGFEHLSRHDNPYEDPLVAVNRHAVRAFLADPDLPTDAFLDSLRADLLGSSARPSDVADLITLHRLYFRSKSYFSAGPAADPRMLHHQLTHGLIGPDDVAWIAEQLAALPDLRSRLAASPAPAAVALADRADDVLTVWTPAERDFLHAHLK